jgi:lysophospholipase L1-like esterase
MTSILAFGDSLTWGADPASGARHPLASRWPEVVETLLKQEIGPDVRVISDGLGGRTTAYDEYTGPCDRNGSRALPVALGCHMPLDLVILMLGTNDLKQAVHGTAFGAASGIKRLIQIVHCFPFDKPGMRMPKVLVVAPPHVREAGGGPPAAGRSIAQSQLFAALYRQMAADHGAAFADAAVYCTASQDDGVHLDRENTEALGRGLVAPIRTALA